MEGGVVDMSPKPELQPEQKEGYLRTLASGFLIVRGAFLLLEHALMWGGFDADDALGHETYGMIMIAVAYLISARRNGKWLIGKK